MAELDSMTMAEESSSGKRQWLSSTKFWVIAFLLHVVFLALLTQIGWVIRTGRTLIGMNVEQIPEGVDISVAIPGAPPGPGLAGPPTPDIKVPLAGQPAATPENIDANPAPDLTAVAAAISTTGPSGFSLPGRVAAGIPGVLEGLPGQGKAFGQGGTGNIPAAWGKRFAKDKPRISDRITEEAVLKALRWLKDNQLDDGSWIGAKDTDPKQWGGYSRKSPVGMTGLALLTFLAHGETPTTGEFRSTVQRGLTWLIDQVEKRDGKPGAQWVEYETGIATYALAEAYGMTTDPRLKPYVEKCVDVIIKSQTAAGGWDYGYAVNNTSVLDVSISAWQIQALKAAYLARVKPAEITQTLEKAMACARKAYTPIVAGSNDKGAFLYRSERIRESLVGAGLLSLLYWNQGNTPEATGAAKYIKEDVGFFNGLAQQEASGNRGMAGNWSRTGGLYAYYYITQAVFLYDGPNGPNWKSWNEKFNDQRENDPKKRALIAAQKEDGSYPQIGDTSWHSGPVYNTALATLMLEVYYRNLPSAK